jgi:hypothetical protein
VGLLAQENFPVSATRSGRLDRPDCRRVPTRACRGSGGRFDVRACSLPHPDLREGTHDGLRHLRVDSGRYRRRPVYDQRIRILRSLFLPLVSPADEADRADALVPLCRDRPLAKTMGARAEALVAESFTWRTQAAQLATYYDDLVGVQPCRN